MPNAPSFVLPSLRRLPLARLPTPLELLAGPPIAPEVRVWIKRDDLTGSDLTGNKVRKLEYLLAEAQRDRCTAVVTTGGAQSNHARATALAARRLGMSPFLLLRADSGPSTKVQGNQLLDALAGATVRWVTAEEYLRRDALMADWAAELSRSGHRCKIIPEGGSNATGSLGYVRAGLELAEQGEARGVRFDSIVTACGSGGTAAGLLVAHMLKPVRAPRPVAVPVCDDAATFRPRVRAVVSDLLRRVDSPKRSPSIAALDWIDGFVGPGYARNTRGELDALAVEARTRGMVWDPTYTGKAWRALVHTLRTQPGRLGREVVFLHSGGLPSVFAWAGTWSQPLAATD